MRNNIGIIAILLISLIVRLISLNQSLWLDEAINVIYARSNDFWWFVTVYPKGDFHPFGWFGILWVWGNLFGWSEISVRLPSVFFGVGTVFVSYLIGKELVSRKVGLIAALLLGLAPLHIYYSQEARMYSLSALAVTLSVYGFILLMEKRKFGQTAFIIASILVLYSDYVAYFIFPSQLIYLLFWKKDLLKKYFLSLCITGILFVPWLFILPGQLISGQQTAKIIQGWKEVVGGASLKEFLLLGVKTIVGRISFYNPLYYGIFILLVSTPFLAAFLKLKSAVNQKSVLILCWLIIPPFLVWIFSLFIPIFSYFRLLYVLPAFYLLTAMCVVRFSSFYFRIILTLIVLTEIFVSGLYLFNDQYHRENWKEASSLGNQQNAVILFEDDTVLAPYTYYDINRSNALPGLKNKPAETINDVNDLQVNLLKGKNILLYNYLVEIYDPHQFVERKLESLGYKKVKTYDYRGVGFIYLFSKN